MIETSGVNDSDESGDGISESSEPAPSAREKFPWEGPLFPVADDGASTRPKERALLGKRRRPSRWGLHEQHRRDRIVGRDSIDSQGRKIQHELAEKGWWVLQPPRLPGGAIRRSEVRYWEHTVLEEDGDQQRTEVRPIKAHGVGVGGDDRWALEMPTGRFLDAFGEPLADLAAVEAFLCR